MKVLHAVGWYPPRSLGGTELYVKELAARQIELGMEVEIAVPAPEIRAPEVERVDGVSVLRYPIPAAPTRAEARGEVPARGAEALHEHLETQRPDVFHAHTFVTGLGLHELVIARRVCRRVIATTHSSRLGFHCARGTLLLDGKVACDGEIDLRRCASCCAQQRGAPAGVAGMLGRLPPALSTSLGRIPGRVGTALGLVGLVAREQLRQADLYAQVDRFVVLTKLAERILVAHGAPPDRLAVIPLGIRAMLAAPGRARATDGTITLGYVGRFEEVKGVDDLLAAFAALPTSAPVRLSLRGPIEPAQAAARAIRLAVPGLAGRVDVGGPLAPDEVSDFIAGLDLLICPSRCHEGGPTVALEAHALGVPAVVTRDSGAGDALADVPTGLDRVFTAGDVAALTALLRRIVSDRRGTIERWRSALPRPRPMSDVARDYQALYD